MKDIYKPQKLLIISSAPLILKDSGYAAYSPYAKEMEIWARNTEEIYFCCPIWKSDRGLLNATLNFNIDEIFQLKEFAFNDFGEILFSIKAILYNFYRIIKAMGNSDHLHIRCPGNIGVLACIAQIFFPSKPKSAKYAGNWDPKAQQPFSYKMQKWILSNTFLTRNIDVLVYGDWPNQSKNIKPFFTATYKETDKIDLPPKKTAGLINFLFVGTLSEGKRPLYALKIIEKLYDRGFKVKLDFYGEGPERAILEEYISVYKLSHIATLHGNQNQVKVRKAYISSHFLILPSKSEGWPKVVAEAMFWGSIPLVTSVSCTPNMLDFGKRGLLLDLNLIDDVNKITILIRDEIQYFQMSREARTWSRKYTLEKFEAEIKQILN